MLIINYYTAEHPTGLTNIKRYKKIIIKNIYSNIDWAIYINENKLKYDFIVHPGADPKNIKMCYNGIEKIKSKNKNSQLELSTSFGTITEGGLLCYQNSISNTVQSSYKIKGKEVSFLIPQYDNSKELIIDPPVLTWATFFGGNSTDEIAFSIATDNSGHVYITGEANTTPSDLPTMDPGGTTYFQGTTDGGDAFIAEFDTTGDLLWCTYFGGTNSDRSEHICTDNAGNVYVTGFTFSTDMPLQNLVGAYNQGANGGSNDGFILKFDNVGQLLWSTYFGGSQQEFPRSIAVDNSGNIFCTGRVQSPNMPLANPLGGAYYQSAHGTGTWDAFIWKFSSACALVWSTYYGGSGVDEGYDVTVDQTGNVWMCGYENSTNLPLQNLAGAYNQAANGGGYDAFAAKFTNAGVLSWASYYGGTGGDNFYDIAVDQLNNILITGSTASPNFFTVNPGGGTYFQPALGNANGNVAIVKLNNNAAVQWSTFYGGTNANFFADVGYGIGADSRNDIWVTGHCTSTDFPVLNCNGFFQSNNRGNNGDGFLLQFDNNGFRKWASYYGSWSQDDAYGIAFSAPNNIFITGFTLSNSNLHIVDPGNGAYMKPVMTTSSDAFMAKFTEVPFIPNAQMGVTDSMICAGECINFNDGTANYLPTNWQWTFSGASTATSSTQNPTTICYNTTGTYSVTMQAYNNCINDTAIKIAYITVHPLPNISVSPTLPSICIGDSVTLTANGASTYTWTPTTGLNTNTGAIVLSTPSGPVNTYTINGIDANGCSSSSVISVSVNPLPVAHAGPDDTVCAGTNAILSASGGNNFAWSNGVGTQTTTVNPIVQTVYTVTVSNGNCSDTDHVTIFMGLAPTANAGADDTICRGSSATLSASGGGTYVWSNGASTASTGVSPIIQITYTVTVNNGNCPDADEVTIFLHPPLLVDAGNNVTISPGANTTLSASGGGSYQWMPSQGLNCTTCQNPVAQPTATTKYFLVVTDVNGCTSLDSVLITIEIECGELFVPTAFSPNEDGQNDILFLYGKCLRTLTFSIFDRWGNKVFETNDITQGWNGYFKERLMSTGVFAYTLTAVTDSNEDVIMKGNITLVR